MALKGYEERAIEGVRDITSPFRLGEDDPGYVGAVFHRIEGFLEAREMFVQLLRIYAIEMWQVDREQSLHLIRLSRIAESLGEESTMEPLHEPHAN